ncbi:MAG: hypothetical protein AAF269_05720 [Pseudomonadota bacterium]
MDRFLLLIICVLLGVATAISMHSQESTSPASGDTTPRFLGRTDAPSHLILAQSDQQSADLAAGTFSYRAFVKQTRVEDRHDVYPPADVVSFTYEADGDAADPKRPIIFLFNGGPGSASIWLHMTGFGPDKTSADLMDASEGDVPLTREANPGFLIDVADLVFVDAVGTGLSRVAEDGDEAAFKDLRVDARAMCRFAQNWLKGEDRVGAPVYVVGVSYSTLRAAGMASHPTCGDFRANLRGLIFVSGLLDLRMRHPRDTMGRVSHYPSIAAAAWHRDRVDRSQWSDDFNAFLEEMEAYAVSVLAPAIDAGYQLSPDQERAIIDELHTQLGLDRPSDTVVSVSAAIRSAERKIGGRLPACGYDARFNCRRLGSHPDLPLSAFGRYLEAELVDHVAALTGYEIDPDQYYALRGNRFRSNWDYRFNKSRESGMGTDMADILLRRIKVPKPLPQEVDPDLPGAMQTATRAATTPFGRVPFIEKAPTRIMVASGIHDFVTPYYAMELALLRAGLEPSQFEMHLYEGGHMMYLEKETGHQLAADIRSFIRSVETPS